MEANNADAVMDLLSIGSKNRVTASTNMNAGSSRSHAVFTVSLEQLSRPKSKDAAFPTEDQGAPVNTCSKLTFVVHTHTFYVLLLQYFIKPFHVRIWRVPNA